MNYQQTIDYLYQHLPMFSRIGAAAYKEDLHNTIALCDFLDNPQKKFRSIHIAGTNGKGSTSHMLAALLQKGGYKTGLYTSPHLKDFRERIKVNGEMIAEQFVIDFTELTKKRSEEIDPSFFELTVAMAFEYFASEKVDVAVIETGLGGRLDSTNVITPVLSVITNIGYDHMNLLGNTLEAIAKEKAGIIKQDVPVVIGETLPETKKIFLDKAKEMNAPICFASERYKASNVVQSFKNLECDVTDLVNNCTEHFVLDLNGAYQIKNLCTVLCAEGLLSENGFKIKNEDEKFAFANTKALTGLHGRWEVVRTDPAVILDVAHNEDGVKEIVRSLELRVGSGELRVGSGELRVGSGELGVGSGEPGGAMSGGVETKFHFIIGLVRDKDVSKVLSLLPQEATYYFTNAHIPRAMPFAELKELASKFGLQGEGFDDVNVAINKALFNAEREDVIIVCGSVFVIGEVDIFG